MLVRDAAATLRGDGEHSLIGLHSSGPSGVSRPVDRDRTGLNDAIKHLTGNGLKATDAFADMRSGELYEVGFRAQTTLTALRVAIADLSTAPAAHKHVVFISNGFAIVPPAEPGNARSRSARQPPVPADDDELAVEIARAANEARERGITVSTLDARHFYRGSAFEAVVADPLSQSFIDASRRNLQRLAEATGGTLLEGKSLSEALSSLLARARR